MSQLCISLIGVTTGKAYGNYSYKYYENYTMEKAKKKMPILRGGKGLAIFSAQKAISVKR